MDKKNHISIYVSTYKRMEDTTPEDVKNIIKGFKNYRDPDYLTDMYSNFLLQMKECHLGFPINRFEHCLQTATLAHRNNEDLEYVICALLHDAGEIFDPFNHDHIIAELLKNFISEKNYFILKHHTTFQGYHYWDKIGLDKNAREEFKDSPYYQDCIDFISKYDDIAFDIDYENMKLSEFKPMMQEFFSREVATSFV